jgi:adenine-specific DNA-methyltransferase
MNRHRIHARRIVADSPSDHLEDVCENPTDSLNIFAATNRCATEIHSDIPRPVHNEPPTSYAVRLAERFSSLSSTKQRSKCGQFFTPIEVARFMASIARPDHAIRKALDPGAGTGVLSCALCEYALRKGEEFCLDAFELDPELAIYCEHALHHAKKWLVARGVKMSYKVHVADFVLECARFLSPGLFDRDIQGAFDTVISNPPYFKLSKTDPRSIAASPVIHGQPNIYAIFMAISASLLSEGGVMVTITPRSFATGDYFSRCRQYLFSKVVPEAVHLFDSRKEAFKSDAVLQENVIIRARKTKPRSAATVQVSTSKGPQDINRDSKRVVGLASIVELNSPKAVFHIPAEDSDEAILHFVRRWPNTLHALGMEVSTGPVVAFRARRFLLENPNRHMSSVPLLWLQNVRRLTIQWPLQKRGKPQYILESSSSRYLLVRNQTYVVLRRFSAKEDERRLVAAPLLLGTLPGDTIGLENHLNYIHRPHGRIQQEEAIGLAALLGSSLLDRYFRISNGNTQVNATELRTLPLPPHDTLTRIGRVVRKQLGLPFDVDAVCDELLGVPRRLRNLAKAG